MQDATEVKWDKNQIGRKMKERNTDINNKRKRNFLSTAAAFKLLQFYHS